MGDGGGGFLTCALKGGGEAGRGLKQDSMILLGGGGVFTGVLRGGLQFYSLPPCTFTSGTAQSSILFIYHSFSYLHCTCTCIYAMECQVNQ